MTGDYEVDMVEWAPEIIKRTVLLLQRLHWRGNPCAKPWKVIRVLQVERCGKELPIS